MLHPFRLRSASYAGQDRGAGTWRVFITPHTGASRLNGGLVYLLATAMMRHVHASICWHKFPAILSGVASWRRRERGRIC